MGSPGGAVAGQGEVEGAGGSTQAKGAVLATFEDGAFGQRSTGAGKAEFVSTGRRLAEAMDVAAGRCRMLNGEGEGDPAELGLPARRTSGEEEIRAHARGS